LKHKEAGKKTQEDTKVYPEKPFFTREKNPTNFS